MTRPLTPPEAELVAEETRVLAGLHAELPGARYFARLRVRTAAGERDVLLADRSWTGDAVALVDWRTAPLAEVFFTCEPGDDYELEHDGRTLAGTVVRRHLVHVHTSGLVGLDLPAHRLRRAGDDSWQADDRPAARVAPRPPRQRTRPLSPARVELDPAQRAAVELAVERSLLVLGEAGFGKTTVALHRLAFLARAARDARRPFRALMLVPTPGLQRLATRMLADLAVERVHVDTFERWVAAQARRLFPQLPRRLGETAGPGVRTFKRHPALRAVLPRIVAGTAAMRDVAAGYREAPTSLRDLLLHLFGDRELLAEAAALAPDELGASVLADVLAHTKIQFSATTERAMAHVVVAERLQTLDGRPIDAGTPNADADTIDVEDFAVLFALHRRITGGDRTPHGALSHYQHILLDEAQELAAIELELLARAVAPGGTVTVAGDERQQVDASTAFAGWPAVLAELGRADATTAALTVSYRCPPAIEDVARAILDPAHPPRDRARDDHLLLTRHEHPCHLATALVDALQTFLADDPHAHVAVVCRHVEAARRLHAALARALPARLVEDGEFRFVPGVEVTTVHDVKGLEFDLVVVPDLDAATYPDRPDARRALYVATTRPLHRLWLACAGPWSPLLPTWLIGQADIARPRP